MTETKIMAEKMPKTSKKTEILYDPIKTIALVKKTTSNA